MALRQDWQEDAWTSGWVHRWRVRAGCVSYVVNVALGLYIGSHAMLCIVQTLAGMECGELSLVRRHVESGDQTATREGRST